MSPRACKIANLWIVCLLILWGAAVLVAQLPVVATLTSPVNGATNVNRTLAMQWTTVAGAQAYYLYVGSTPGAKDLVDTGEIQQTSYLATSLPGSQTVFARLWTMVGGVWRSSDSSFTTAATVPVVAILTSPVNGATNVNLTLPIQWTTVAGAQAYYLYVGSTVGTNDLVNTGEIQQTSWLVTGLPGSKTVFARLWTKLGGVWLFSDSSFTTVLAVQAVDPGVRSLTVDAGLPLASVASTPGLSNLVTNGSGQFAEHQTVGGDNNGLGPRFNNDSCGSCHSQPANGGTSPSLAVYPFVGQNPQFQTFGGTNSIPIFVTADGPVREARFKFFLNPDGSLSTTQDGGVHDLFVISGRNDAALCSIDQPDFATNLALGNVIFRIPTPLFGAGLIENIDDATILANMSAQAVAKAALGITGHPNRNGNDGTITRFGWKAQNKSLEIFAGEAYNVEMGVSNELFPTERPSPGDTVIPVGCLLNPTPEDTTHFAPGAATASVPSDVTQFAVFMRTLAPPTPSTTFPGGASSIANGRQMFISVGCSLCHTPTLMTAASSLTADLSSVQAKLFSDLLVHHMGQKLADGVSQGNAGLDEFRTAPLWGLGQRIFFLHDGRTSDLLTAIRQHESTGSEASGVIDQFQALTQSQKQDLLNFLRSL
jgi:hypothetical protein